MSNTDYKIIVQAALDEAQSKKNIEKSLKKLAEKLKVTIPLTIDKARLEKEAKSITTTMAKYITELDRIKLSNRMTVWLEQSAAASEELTAQIRNLVRESNSCDVKLLDGIKKEFEELISFSSDLIALEDTLGSSTKNTARGFTAWAGIELLLAAAANVFIKMKDEVFELDAALTDLSKVSDLTGDTLSAVTRQAYEIGDTFAQTGTNVLSSVTAFQEAGYSIAQSMEYAQEALKTANISDNLKDAGQAAESLVQIMKGFGNETPAFARHINDAVSNVANTQSIDFDTLISGSERLASAASRAGLSFDQMLGTLAGGYEELGNIEQAASGQIAIFSRLQGILPNGERDITAAVRLQNAFSNATAGAVTVIDQETGQLRDVYQILDDLNTVWNRLDISTKEALSIEAAGAEQQNVFLAMMNNWDGVRTAVEAAQNSLGNADKENENYLNSLTGKTNALQASFEKLATTAVSSDFLKGLLDFGTGFLNILDAVIAKFGTLPTLAAGTGAVLGLKNVGRANKGVCELSLISCPSQ